MDTRAVRRRAAVERILEAAWRLARTEGLTGFTLRQLGAEVGMRAPSLYSYFDSKHALYDAMFAQANRELLETVEPPDPDDFEASFRRSMKRFSEWSVSDPVRHQLLFQRTIPGFEPSPDSYAVAQELSRRMTDAFAAAGIRDPRAFDLWTAISAGIDSQQLANDPRGDRYTSLLDEAIDMYLDHVGYRRRAGTRKGKEKGHE